MSSPYITTSPFTSKSEYVIPPPGQKPNTPISSTTSAPKMEVIPPSLPHEAWNSPWKRKRSSDETYSPELDHVRKRPALNVVPPSEPPSHIGSQQILARPHLRRPSQSSPSAIPSTYGSDSTLRLPSIQDAFPSVTRHDRSGSEYSQAPARHSSESRYTHLPSSNYLPPRGPSNIRLPPISTIGLFRPDNTRESSSSQGTSAARSERPAFSATSNSYSGTRSTTSGTPSDRSWPSSAKSHFTTPGSSTPDYSARSYTSHPSATPHMTPRAPPSAHGWSPRELGVPMSRPSLDLSHTSDTSSYNRGHGPSSSIDSTSPGSLHAMRRARHVSYTPPDPHELPVWNEQLLDDQSPRRRRGNLPKESTAILNEWFGKHLNHPYPTEDEKTQFQSKTGLSMSQISNWFINARRRRLTNRGPGKDEQRHEGQVLHAAEI